MAVPEDIRRADGKINYVPAVILIAKQYVGLKTVHIVRLAGVNGIAQVDWRASGPLWRNACKGPTAASPKPAHHKFDRRSKMGFGQRADRVEDGGALCSASCWLLDRLGMCGRGEEQEAGGA